MICNQAQSMITPFVKNELNIQETESFLNHMGSCSNCREELDFYYVLLTAMKQLDEDRELSLDYKKELAYKMERAQEKIIHIKYTYLRKKTLLILLMIFLAFLFSFGYADKSVDTIDALGEDYIHSPNTYFIHSYEERQREFKIFFDKERIGEIVPEEKVYNKE